MLGDDVGGNVGSCVGVKLILGDDVGEKVGVGVGIPAIKIGALVGISSEASSMKAVGCWVGNSSSLKVPRRVLTSSPCLGFKILLVSNAAFEK